MQRFLLALCFCLGLGLSAHAQSAVGPTNAIVCNKTATFTGLSANTVLVAAVTNLRVVMCGWHVTNSSATAYTFAITYGTQTTNPCDTGTITVTPALSVTQSAPSADHVDFAGTGSNLSQALCISPSNAAVSGLVFYAQF